jgi:hypothetical protein
LLARSLGAQIAHEKLRTHLKLLQNLSVMKKCYAGP